MGATAHDRIQAGRKRRTVVSRQSLADLNPKDRSFDPLDILVHATDGRLRRLLPIKYGRMKASPFAFFRGSVAIMAADLARLPNTGIHAQLCGDAHVQNMGSFTAPDGRLVFDLNDFDETIRGPWEWDVKRMAASFVLVAREIGRRDDTCRDALAAFLESYCRSIRAFATAPLLAVARHQVRRADQVRVVQKATPLDLLKRLTEPDTRHQPRFRDLRPVSWRITGKAAHEILRSLDFYRETLAPERRHLFNLFRSIDVGFRVAGTGSVGLRNYAILMEGNGPKDVLFLQLKQEAASTYARYLPGGANEHNGRRVVIGQRAVQTNSDLLLGWTTIGQHQYMVRQLNDHKGTIDLSSLRGPGLNTLAAVAGELLARGHARSGDACEIGGYCGAGPKVSKALTTFALAYADQVESDFEAFTSAIRRAIIPVE